MEVEGVDFNDSFASVSPGMHGRVLTVLSRTEQPLTGRVVAGLVRPAASTSGVQRVLDELVRDGLVLRETAGRAYLYRLNRNHLAAPAVMSLAGLRLELTERIATRVEQWAIPPVAVWLFGSTFQGTAGPESDVDLVVIRPDEIEAADTSWNADLSKLSVAVFDWTGNGCDVVDRTVAELLALRERGDRLITELERGSAAIVGPMPWELLGRRVAT